jgi:CDP-glucose 4,6-dehydratase
MFNDIYRDRSILVTGHTGFKGSWLSIWLNELKANVIGYALDPYTKNDNFVVTNLSDKIKDIRGDIRDFKKVTSVFDKHRPEIVFHLAAQSLVRTSYREPRLTYETNIMGTVNVLEAARKCDSVKAIVIITSDKCYENREWIWGYRERDPVGGYDPYSSSKGCAELVVSAYNNSFFNFKRSCEYKAAVASVRAGNVIGGGDWADDRLIPDCMKSLKVQKPVKIRNPNAIRPWQHVLEPLNGYLLLASKLFEDPKEYVGAWNFGPSDDAMISVKDLIEKVLRYWGNGIWIDVSNDEQPHEAQLLKLDISKARYLLEWKPKLNIDTTIKMVVDWYKKDNINYDFDVKQLEEFIDA